MMIELLPCPICGKRPTINTRGRAGGVVCAQRTHRIQTYGRDTYGAVEIWNQRTPPPSSESASGSPDDILAQIEKVRSGEVGMYVDGSCGPSPVVIVSLANWQAHRTSESSSAAPAMTDPTAAARALYEAMGYAEWDRQPESITSQWINGAAAIERVCAVENEDLRRTRAACEQQLQDQFAAHAATFDHAMTHALASEQRVKALEAALEAAVDQIIGVTGALPGSDSAEIVELARAVLSGEG